MNNLQPITVPAEGGYIDSAPFWQGTREGRLLLQYCLDTARFQHPPGPVSVYTGSRRLAWKEVAGRGRIHALTTLRAKGLGADGHLPYLLGLIELDEGVRILAHLCGPAPDGWRVGDAVALGWEVLDDGRPYPMFVQRSAPR